MRYLVTRPIDDAEKTAARLRALGHEALIDPLLRVDTLEPEPIAVERLGAVALTSVHALHALHLRPEWMALSMLPFYCVGRRTSEAARRAGAVTVIDANGTMDELAVLIAADRDLFVGRPVLYACGTHRSGDLAAALQRQDLGCVKREVYQALAAEALAPATEEALEAAALDGVLLFSRRSAEVFINCAAGSGMGETARGLMCHCLSEAVAAPLREAGFSRVVVAGAPNQAALLETLVRR